jgi:dipeptidyl aminopeptidase/acylaminoacyl peptidase
MPLLPAHRPLRTLARTALFAATLLAAPRLQAQGTAEDYARAAQLGQRFTGLLVDVAERPTWIDADRFWYRKSVRGGNEFVLVTVSSKAKSAPFDHARLAAGLNAVTQGRATALTLPFTSFTVDGTRAVQVTVGPSSYECTLSDYVCSRTGAAPTGPGAGGRGGAVPAADDIWEVPSEDWDEDRSQELEVFAARLRLAQAQVPGQAQVDTAVLRSPDGTREVYVQNYNLWVRPVAANGTNGAGGRGGAGGGRGGAPGAMPGAAPREPGVQLTWDGSEGNAYVLGGGGNRAVRWSPDGKKLAALRVTPGYQRLVRFIETSPSDQLQPKWREQYYQKPGDVVTQRVPVLIDVESKRVTPVDNALFPNAYAITALAWWEDSRGFTFEYNQRGHQVYRVIEVDATTGKARALISEEPETFFSYRPPDDALGSGGGTRWRRDLADGREILWMSERDGWKHLYLYDGRTGRVKNQVTKGAWVLRNVHAVDTAARRIWFVANGRDAGQDPYFLKYHRINFDGTGLVSYTPEDGTHTVTWSTDTAYYVDQWQRPDLPTVTVLKRTSDQSVVMELERGDASALVAAGYQMAEPFVAKGRDGVTDIWGVIVKPTSFDPSKQYPVIEQIYAGPQGSFAPKTFQVSGATRTLAEHGFIVVQVDGMGTANRSKAFHDVAWRNLGDAGFPDRVLWHKAIAAKYSWYDATRVGIYGGSAGGQNAMGALLFHGDFYTAAFSSVGCHDNRMDKIWWNEQWMGWPIGEHYERASNMVNAHLLKGKLMLVVGELDTNVDPASTMQVVNALVRAQKDFELIVLPGQGHTNGGAYGVRRMTDFFVRSLTDATPPERNAGG